MKHFGEDVCENVVDSIFFSRTLYALPSDLLRCNSFEGSQTPYRKKRNHQKHMILNCPANMFLPLVKVSSIYYFLVLFNFLNRGVYRLRVLGFYDFPI